MERNGPVGSGPPTGDRVVASHLWSAPWLRPRMTGLPSTVPYATGPSPGIGSPIGSRVALSQIRMVCSAPALIATGRSSSSPTATEVTSAWPPMSIATGDANEAGTPPCDVSWQVVPGRGQLTTVDPAEAAAPTRPEAARQGWVAAVERTSGPLSPKSLPEHKPTPRAIRQKEIRARRIEFGYNSRRRPSELRYRIPQRVHDEHLSRRSAA